MATFSSTQPSLRARVLPRFPALVKAGNGMIISKSGGTYTFEVAALGALALVHANRLLGRDIGDGIPQEITIAGGLQFTGVGGIQLSDNQRARSLTVQFKPVTAGLQQDIVVPLSCQVTRVTLLADVTGSTVVDFLKCAYVNYPTFTSICAGAKATISSGVKFQGVANIELATWIKTIVAGDIIRIHVDSVTAFTQMAVAMDVLTT